MNSVLVYDKMNDYTQSASPRARKCWLCISVIYLCAVMDHKVVFVAAFRGTLPSSPQPHVLLNNDLGPVCFPILVCIPHA